MSPEARAAIFEGPGQPLRVQSVPIPRLQPGEALVAVRLATICGSDVHTYEGRREVPCPTILGHEIVGTVVDHCPQHGLLDAAGQRLVVGDRVTWAIIANCGDCFYCGHDLPQKCERLFKYGHERLTPEASLSGGLATHCRLARGTHVFRVPESLPDAVVAPASCATATVAAVLRHAGDLSGASVLVQGAGMLGLTAAAWARVRGAREVVVCDRNMERLETARRFGATRILGADMDVRSLQEQIAPLNEGRGVDVVLEMSGSASAVTAGIDLLRMGGRAVWVGAVFPTRVPEFSAERVVRKCLSIQGVHNYQPHDLGTALDFLAAHHTQFPFAELVGATFPLNEVESAFQSARQGKALRLGIRA